MKISTSFAGATLVLFTTIASVPVQAQTSRLSASLPLTVAENSPIAPLIFAAPPVPPTLGTPGQRRDGAASRCPLDSTVSPPPPGAEIVALVPLDGSTEPASVFSKSSADAPEILIYVPYQPPYQGKFVVQNPAGESLYEGPVEMPESPGIINLSFPSTIPPLAPGEPYHWFFIVYEPCQSPAPPAFVEGWLQRDPLPSATAAQLAQMSPSEQADFYAANGLWHDALTTAAALHQSDADDTHWTDLLQAVGLEDLISEPIVDF